MLPRHNPEARGRPARARCSQRSAGMPDVFRRSGAGDRPVVPQEREWNCARDQYGRLFVVRVRARNRQVRRAFHRGTAGQYTADGTAGAPSSVFGHVREKPHGPRTRHAHLARCARAVSSGARRLETLQPLALLGMSISYNHTSDSPALVTSVIQGRLGTNIQFQRGECCASTRAEMDDRG
jgi:hypothetical protein